MAELSTQEKEHVQLELDKLNEAVANTTDFSEKLDLKDKIHNMTKSTGYTEPASQ